MLNLTGNNMGSNDEQNAAKTLEKIGEYYKKRDSKNKANQTENAENAGNIETAQETLISVCLIVAEHQKCDLNDFMRLCLKGDNVELIIMESARISRAEYDEYAGKYNIKRDSPDLYYITNKHDNGPLKYYVYNYVSEYTELIPSFKHIRNEVKKRACGKWIFSIDIDEVLPPYMHKEIISLIQQLPDNIDGVNVAIASMVNDYSDNNRSYINSTGVRIFRNVNYIQWQPNMHEMVNFSIPEEKIYFSNIQLIHSGYCIDKNTFHNKLLHRVKVLARDIFELPEGRQFDRALIYLSNNIEKYKKLIQGEEDE